jgi:hypothetical protein
VERQRLGVYVPTLQYEKADLTVSFLKVWQRCNSQLRYPIIFLRTLSFYSSFSFTYLWCASWQLSFLHFHQFLQIRSSFQEALLCGIFFALLCYFSFFRMIPDVASTLADGWPPTPSRNFTTCGTVPVVPLILRYYWTIALHGIRMFRKHECSLRFVLWTSLKGRQTRVCDAQLSIFLAPHNLPTRFPLFDWTTSSSIWGTLPLPSATLPTAIIWRSVCRPL